MPQLALPTLDTPPKQSSRPHWPVVAFAGTILLSAFLLFQVQPLISKFILPWFGGAPAVWTTCMLFFQLVLFAGYSYAHLVGSKLSPRAQAVVQGAVLLAALALLPITPHESWKPAGSQIPTWRILLLLAATVGLPYFVLSTTSPLVQVWFSRGYPGRSPYRLYALSNFGSLVALLSYPFVFEPAFDLPVQSHLWSWAFGGYVLLCGACAAWTFVRRTSGPLAQDRATDGNPGGARTEADNRDGCPTGLDNRDGRPTWLKRALWVLLPACASLMLLATTNHVCQDVTVVPFLWVVPLALYLLSFIICFDHQRWYVRGLWAAPAVLGIVAVSGSSPVLDWLGKVLHRDLSLNYIQELTLYFSTMFFICMVCHGELVRLRPQPRRLTEYYLLIAAGGAVGGVLVGLVAPQVFNTFFEWQIALVISYLIAGAVLLVATARGAARLLRGAGKGAAAGRPAAIVATQAVGLLVAGGLAAVVYWEASGWSPATVERARNFFGVVSVREYDRDKPEHAFALRHGAVTHGLQLAAPEKRRRPLTYYSEESGVGRAVACLQAMRPKMSVGVVGLGVGTVASYARPGDTYRFYEINPAVTRFAEEPKYFTYLSDARRRGAAVEIVPGDARLSLEREERDEPQQFDLLVLDAFSGDSVPAHLLTHEAFTVYRKHLAAGGVIAVHATNSYLYLAPVVRRLAEDSGLRFRRVYTLEDEARDVLSNDWLLLTNDTQFLASVPDVPPPPELEDEAIRAPLWTDHYNNLFQVLR